MGLEFTVEESEAPEATKPIPDDTMCNATLLVTKVKQRKFDDDPEPVDRLSWQFRVEDAEYYDKFVWGDTGVKLSNHPNCKLYNWSAAVLGIELPIGYHFKEEDLWRRPCRILVGARDGKNKKGEDAVFNYVEDVLPAAAGTTPEDEPF